ncbi:MAG: methylated-DNA--[protein]-cysteine S-methyltransferase [Vicinamibacterales bacterium]
MSEAVIASPIGPLGLETVGESAVRRISFHAEGRPAAGLTGLLAEVNRQLTAYFEGRLQAFDLPIAPEGTPFQQSVWRALCAIPYGRTVTYASLARTIGRPAAVRAVGAANGRNPIPIVIPCHRVIGSSGQLVGFGGGLNIKRRLLDLEAAGQLRIGDLPFAID